MVNAVEREPGTRVSYLERDVLEHGSVRRVPEEDQAVGAAKYLLEVLGLQGGKKAMTS